MFHQRFVRLGALTSVLTFHPLIYPAVRGTALVTAICQEGMPIRQQWRSGHRPTCSCASRVSFCHLIIQNPKKRVFTLICEALASYFAVPCREVFPVREVPLMVQLHRCPPARRHRSSACSADRPSSKPQSGGSPWPIDIVCFPRLPVYQIVLLPSEIRTHSISAQHRDEEG